MKYTYQILLLLTLVSAGFLISTPVTEAALYGIVGCGNNSQVDGQGFVNDECTLCDLQKLAVRFVNFVILFATAFAALLFMNAGFLYVMSPSNPGNIAKGHHLFMNTLIGFVIILAAWLIVNLIMSTLLSNTFGDWKNILCTSSVQQSTAQQISTIPQPKGAGPGYVAGDFVSDPKYSTGAVLSSEALAKGLNNISTNCTAGGMSCTDYIIAQANAANVDPNYALALAAIESGGCTNPATCTSPVGAVGVIQLMPATARELCGASCANMSDAEMKTYLSDPAKNIELGVKYMAQSSSYVDQQMAAHPERFDPERKEDYMAAYYNGGAAALEASKDCGPTSTKYECNTNPGGYVETQSYVYKMNTYVNSVDKAGEIVTTGSTSGSQTEPSTIDYVPGA